MKEDGRETVSRRSFCNDLFYPTEIHGELHTASVQLQAQGVGWLFGGGGHEQTVRPLRHETQRQVLGLCVHGDGHDDLQVHAAIITQHRCLWTGVMERREEEGRGKKGERGARGQGMKGNRRRWDKRRGKDRRGKKKRRVKKWVFYNTGTKQDTDYKGSLILNTMYFK